MEMRAFGRTGLQVSILGFGCGAVGGLMVRGTPADQERAVARALEAGVNYFDTAAMYGNGESEKNLGRVLAKLKPNVVVGTKVRIPSAEFGRIGAAVAESLEASLKRMGREQVDIFHLHNAITRNGDGESLAAKTVLDEVVPAFEKLREQGKLRFPGITAVGDTPALHQVLELARLRLRAGQLQHAEPERCRGAAGRLSGAGLRADVRPYAGRRRRCGGYSRAGGWRAERCRGAASDRQSATRSDRVGKFI